MIPITYRLDSHKKLSLFCLLVLGSIVMTIGQEKSLTNFSSIDGLSQNQVNCIFQDSKGFIWIGTNDGLNKFDGYDFSTYQFNQKKLNSISSNLIYYIHENRTGDLYLGTTGSGLCIFNQRTGEFRKLDQTGFSGSRIRKILEDSNENIWIGYRGGLDILSNHSSDKNITNLDLYSGDKNYYVTDIIEDQNNHIWVSTSLGLTCFKNGKSDQINFPFFKEQNISDLLLLEDNNLLISSNKGLFCIKTDSISANIRLKNLSSLRISNLTISGKNIICSTINALYSLEWSTNSSFYQNSKIFELEGESISCLTVDKKGLIFIGTLGKGIYIYNPNRKKFRHYKYQQMEHEYSFNIIRSIYEDKEQNLWLGTEGGGVHFLSENNQNYANFISINKINSSLPNTVFCFEETNDKLWYGAIHPARLSSIQTIMVSQNNFNTFYHHDLVHKKVFALHSDSDKNLWVGTYDDGLYRLRIENEQQTITHFTPQNSDISSAIIRSLLEDKYGNIWIGTDNGLNKLSWKIKNNDSINFIVYKNQINDKSSISHNYILPIYETKEGFIWIGTLGGGLNKLIRGEQWDDDKFEAITVDNGLPNNVIKAIIEDNQKNLWLSSNKGLSRFNPSDKSIRNYDVSDGLQDYEFSELSSCKRKNGEILFGGVNGFNAFFPEDIINDTSLVEPVFTDLYVSNRKINIKNTISGKIILKESINYTNEIRLKYQNNNFSISFTALQYTSPKKIKYRYKLDGFDTDWLYTDYKNRIAKYTNIPAGTYTLLLSATNSDGFWNNSQAKKITIIIEPPPLASLPAFIIYSIVLVFLLWFLRRFTIIRIAKKKELLLDGFEKQKVNEISKLKLDFFTNISHEIRTPLTLVISILNKLSKLELFKPNGENARDNVLIRRNINILLRLINQLADFRKYEQGKLKLHVTENNIVSYTREIFDSFYNIANQKNMGYAFHSDQNNINLWFDTDKLEKVLFNLISNALKFTPKNGKIDVTINNTKDQLEIVISDNGIGIPKDRQALIFEPFYRANRIKNMGTGIGLSFAYSLVKMHNGKLLVESTENVGTSFKLILSKGNSHFDSTDLFKFESDSEFHSLPTHEWTHPIAVEQSTASLSVPELSNSPLVLLAEDNILLREFMKENLSNSFKVIEASNGREAFEKCLSEKPDLVVSDILMPEMDGFELCNKIKETRDINDIPVILLTTKSDSETMKKAYAIKADDFMSKPFSLDALESKINVLIQSRINLIEKYKRSISIGPKEIQVNPADEKFLKRVTKIIERNISIEGFSVKKLGIEVGSTPVLLNKKIKKNTGLTTNQFIRLIKLQRASQLLKLGATVTESAFESGFEDLKYFRINFKKEFGLTPNDFRKKFVS